MAGPSILAIVSKAIFESEALVGGRNVEVGEIWPVDRYNSKNKAFTPLREGGRIVLVTVRPPGERLWFLGSLEAPLFDGVSWVARAPNSRPVMDITALRRKIIFASGKGISVDEGALAMSLQTPRALSEASAAEILAVVGGTPASVVADKSPPLETSEERNERLDRMAALEAEVDRFVVLFDRMQETHGLRMPEGLAYAAGFLMGLRPEERAEVEANVGRLAGVGAWFGHDQLSPPPGGDERLRDRLVTDPPELVPVFACSNGWRWGLWYDDTDELPTGIAERASAVKPPGFHVELVHPTLLLALRARIAGGWSGERRTSILAWVDDVLRVEAAKVRERTPIPMRRQGSVIGLAIDPHVPDWHVPVDLLESSQKARLAAYASGAEVVDDWIDQARADLRDGSPGRALFLGWELHGLQATRWRLACTELLVRAYAALERRPLADIVQAVYRHADPSAPIYELPPAHPVVVAARGMAGAADEEAIALALARGGVPSPEEVEEALANAGSVEILDALLEKAGVSTGGSSPTSSDSALWRHVGAALRARKPAQAARHRALAVRLMERRTPSLRVFERVLWSKDAELVLAAAGHVDTSATTVRGDGPLHLAARHASPAAVRVLLDRKADVRARNAEARTAVDLAREAQGDAPHDPAPSEIVLMLQASPGGLAKPRLLTDQTTEYVEGDLVHHKKLGDGVVQSVTGAGEEAKLLIKFESETRTFLAKFVTPRGS